MPTYEYRCGDCGEVTEAVQSFTDAPLTVCPACGQAALRKMFGNVGVVFKGSGFYRNDARAEAKDAAKKDAAKKGAAEASKPDGSAKPDASAKPAASSDAAGSAKKSPSTDSKPAAKPAAAPA